MKYLPILCLTLTQSLWSQVAPVMKAGHLAGNVAAAAPTDTEVATELHVGRSEGESTKVLWKTDAGTKKLESVPGTIGRTWVYVAVLFWVDFPQKHADIRIKEAQPEFFINMEKTPKNRMFLVKCRVNGRTKDRSVKMGQAGVITYHGISAPDPDWTIPFEAVEVEAGLWKVKPSQPLEPGEYGFFSGAAAAYLTKGHPAGELFDFGVDPNGLTIAAK